LTKKDKKKKKAEKEKEKEKEKTKEETTAKKPSKMVLTFCYFPLFTVILLNGNLLVLTSFVCHIFLF